MFNKKLSLTLVVLYGFDGGVGGRFHRAGPHLTRLSDQERLIAFCQNKVHKYCLENI
jgi:hypothetical protein